MSMLRIPRRFCGPPQSGNGGYSCGCVAAFLGERATVRLHKPPPLDLDLHVHDVSGAVELRDGDTLIASGRPERLPLDIPPPPTLAQAEDAATRYLGVLGSAHPFPGCFVCGPERALGDGLCLFTGPTRDDSMVAAPFTPPEDLFAGDALRPEIVWAALDCPGFFGALRSLVPMVLGELSVEQRAPVPRGTHIAYAWSIAHDGRKEHVGSALARADGTVLAAARATWIRLKS